MVVRVFTLMGVLYLYSANWSIINNKSINKNTNKRQNNEGCSSPTSEEFNNYFSNIGIGLSNKIKSNTYNIDILQ